MRASDPVRAIETNLFDAWRFLAAIPNVEYHHCSKLIRYIGGIPVPLCNSIMRANLSAEAIDVQINEALAPIRSRRLPLFWWIGPATRPLGLGTYLQREGLIPVEQIPGMAADLHTIPDHAADPSGMEIREVRDAAMLDTWIEVFRTCFEMPDVAANFFANGICSIGFHPDLSYRHYVGFWRDEPAACSSVYLGDVSAGIYNLATLPAFRGRGIGSALTRRLMRLARERGIRVSVLHSTPLGKPVYEKLGFTELCRLTVYLWEPGALPGSADGQPRLNPPESHSPQLTAEIFNDQ
jgi:ribosomal protein S18 acetylase RimI-like enzyme